jgi:hypothetical protein
MFLIYSCVATASVIFAIAVVMPLFLVAGAFIAAIYIFIGSYYVATSRDLKRKSDNSIHLLNYLKVKY